jgi:hypothetical protein
MGTVTAQFDSDVSAAPYSRDFALQAINDDPAVTLTVAGFLPGDVIQQVSFTAKVNPTDADNAPTSVQHIWQPPNGTTGPQVTPADSSAAVYGISIPLTQADSVILATLHGYDVRVWILRGGVSIARTILRGNIITYLGNTSLSAPVGGGFTDEDGTLLVDEGYE